MPIISSGERDPDTETCCLRPEVGGPGPRCLPKCAAPVSDLEREVALRVTAVLPAESRATLPLLFRVPVPAAQRDRAFYESATIRTEAGAEPLPRLAR